MNQPTPALETKEDTFDSSTTRQLRTSSGDLRQGRLQLRKRNSTRSSTRIQSNTVITTPFTSSRYHSKSVTSRPYNLASPRGSTNKNTSISSRLAEVKRLVEAGFVKKEVYDKLVGANTQTTQTTLVTQATLTNETTLTAGGTTSDNDDQVENQVDDVGGDIDDVGNVGRVDDVGDATQHNYITGETKDIIGELPSPHRSVRKGRSSSFGGLRPTNNHNDDDRKKNPLSRHQSRHTMIDGSILLQQLHPANEEEEGLGRPRSNTKNGWKTKMKSFLRMTKSSQHNSTGSPLDVPVVSQKMLNYKVTMMAAPEKAADVSGTIYTMFVMLVTYEEETENKNENMNELTEEEEEEEEEKEEEEEEEQENVKDYDENENSSAFHEEWVIRRRYRVFNSLHLKVCKLLQGTPLFKSLPKFPSKSVMSQLFSSIRTDEFLTKRMNELEAYLEGLICLSTRNVACSKHLKEFLHAPDVMYTGEDETQLLKKVSSEIGMSPFRAAYVSHDHLNRNQSSMRIIIDVPSEADDGDADKIGTSKNTKLPPTVLVSLPAALVASAPASAIALPPQQSQSQSQSQSSINLLQQRVNTTSPIPTIPPRPASHNKEQTDQVNLHRHNRTASLADKPDMVKHAALSAANVVEYHAKKKSMAKPTEPARKLIKGRDGGYRWQYREDIAPLQNYLFKRGGFRGGSKNWKRRWIVLKDFVIFYYRTTKPVLLGTMNLDTTTTVDVLSVEMTPQGVPLGYYSFVINTLNRSLYVYSEKKNVGEEWTRVIRQQVQIMQEQVKAKEKEEEEKLMQKITESGIDTQEDVIPYIPPPPSLPPAPELIVVTAEEERTSTTELRNNDDVASLQKDYPKDNELNDEQKKKHNKTLSTTSNASSTGSFVVMPTDSIQSASSSILFDESSSHLLPNQSLQVSVLRSSSTLGNSTDSINHRRAQSSGEFVNYSFKRATISHVSRSHWELDFDQLTFGGELGKGAYGIVHQGTLWGTDVAIKRLTTKGFSLFDNNDDMMNDSQKQKAKEHKKKLLTDLRNEVKILSELRHPNVVLYIGVCTKLPNICIVTELCPRRSLFNIIHDPSIVLSSELRLRMALQTAQGMAYLHNQFNRIIHRDLKSHNLLVGENFDIKVADFGLTVVRQNVKSHLIRKRRESAASSAAARSSSKHLHSSDINDNRDIHQSMGGHYGVHGTPQWMAPEVMEGSPYNGKVDVYSYGIVLCEVFSRILPFSDRYRAFEFIEAVLEQGATPTIPRWCYNSPVTTTADSTQNQKNKPPTHRERGATQTLSQAIPQDWASFDWTSTMEDDNEDNASDRSDRLELPEAIQSLRRGTLRKVIIQCLDRDPKQRPSFDLLVAALRNVLMPTTNSTTSEEDWGMGPRVFLEFDLPRIVETLRDSTYLLSRAPGDTANSQSNHPGMVMTSRLLHGAAVCREIDDIFTAMNQPDPLRGIPMCSDDHRYMCLQPSPFPLAHPLATQVVCLLAQYLVGLLDAVTGWISQNGMIAASYEPVSILWDVLGALEAIIRMQDPIINRAHGRAMYYDRTHHRRRHRRSSSISGGTPNNRSTLRSTVKTAVVLDVLRNAGLVSSVIALFALLPEDVTLLSRRKIQNDKNNIDANNDDSRDASFVNDSNYDSNDDGNDDDNGDDGDDDGADDDETMLRDQLCKSAHLGGIIISMLLRLDDECIMNTEDVLNDSLSELMEIPEEHLGPLERRFTKYLHNVTLPDQLVDRFKSLHMNQ